MFLNKFCWFWIFFVLNKFSFVIAFFNCNFEDNNCNFKSNIPDNLEFYKFQRGIPDFSKNSNQG